MFCSFVFLVNNNEKDVDYAGSHCLFFCISVSILSTLSDEYLTDDGAYFRLTDNGLFEQRTGSESVMNSC